MNTHKFLLIAAFGLFGYLLGVLMCVLLSLGTTDTVVVNESFLDEQRLAANKGLLDANTALVARNHELVATAACFVDAYQNALANSLTTSYYPSSVEKCMAAVRHEDYVLVKATLGSLAYDFYVEEGGR